MGIKQFMNLISKFSPDSPMGQVEQLIATPDKDLSGQSKILKNRYIFKRNKHLLSEKSSVEV